MNMDSDKMNYHKTLKRKSRKKNSVKAKNCFASEIKINYSVNPLIFI